MTTGAELCEAARLARSLVEATDFAGRPLAAAHAELPWPDTDAPDDSGPVALLWQACAVLREHRGDAHWAATSGEGIDVVECHVLHAADGAYGESMTTQVNVSRDIAAPADKVWAMVSDLTRMGEWSPENQGGSWVGGATGPATGAKFKGRNQAGKKKWSTVSTVTACEPGKVFTFVSAVGPLKAAEWSYRFEPTPTGCRVTENWTDRRPGWTKPLAKLATGVADRAEHNRAGMEQTLERLAAAATAPQ